MLARGGRGVLLLPLPVLVPGRGLLLLLVPGRGLPLPGRGVPLPGRGMLLRGMLLLLRGMLLLLRGMLLLLLGWSVLVRRGWNGKKIQHGYNGMEWDLPPWRRRRRGWNGGAGMQKKNFSMGTMEWNGTYLHGCGGAAMAAAAPGSRVFVGLKLHEYARGMALAKRVT
jgi:hypothetical protein